MKQYPTCESKPSERVFTRSFSSGNGYLFLDTEFRRPLRWESARESESNPPVRRDRSVGLADVDAGASEVFMSSCIMV